MYVTKLRCHTNFRKIKPYNTFWLIYSIKILPVFLETVPSVPSFWRLMLKIYLVNPRYDGGMVTISCRWLGCHYLPHSNCAFLKQIRLIRTIEYNQIDSISISLNIEYFILFKFNSKEYIQYNWNDQYFSSEIGNCRTWQLRHHQWDIFCIW